MFKTKWKNIGVMVGLTLLLIAAGCGDKDDENSGGADSSNVSKELEYTITGIEPGAGQTETNEQAIEAYDSLTGWKQETASSAAMLTALEQAIDKEEPIIVAAWSPHYKFAKWDLKYLDDPKGVFGEAENITTIVRQGLKDDNPVAYELFDRFNWELSDVEAALLRAQEIDFDFETVAAEWVEDNPGAVAEWADGLDTVDGTSLHLATTPWDTELFSANVAKLVFEQQGFNVEFSVVDPAVLFEAISSGSADGSLSPWMPSTHGAFYSEYEGQFEDLGENVTGARIGLAVPTYMDIDSIEDLDPAE